MKKPLAVITMVFNEHSGLPRWISHYSKQVEHATDLYVVDHGSTDGSSDLLPCKTIKLAREEGKGRYEKWRVEFISDLCAKLLLDYEAVLYVDCDEMVIADPRSWNSLAEYATCGGKCNATFGYDVLHRFEEEPSLNGNETVLKQRDRLLFLGAMCKPTFIRTETKFSTGFHTSNDFPIYGDLFRFHLRYADINVGLARLEITRNIENPELDKVKVNHHKISDETYIQWVKNWLKFPVVEDEIGLENPDFKEFKIFAGLDSKEMATTNFNYSYRGKRTYRVPSEFRNSV